MNSANTETITITFASLYPNPDSTRLLYKTANGTTYTSPFNSEAHATRVLNNVKAIAVGYTCFNAVAAEQSQAVQNIPIDTLDCTPLSPEQQQWVNKGQQLLDDGLLTRNEFLEYCAQGQYYDPESRMLYKPAEKSDEWRKEHAILTNLTETNKLIKDALSEPEPIPNNMELQAILSFPENVPFVNNERADYTCIDLFAGIGGTRLGFNQTGRVSFVFSSEFNKFSAKTYAANFGEMPSGDITQIDSSFCGSRS